MDITDKQQKLTELSKFFAVCDHPIFCDYKYLLFRFLKRCRTIFLVNSQNCFNSDIVFNSSQDWCTKSQKQSFVCNVIISERKNLIS